MRSKEPLSKAMDNKNNQEMTTEESNEYVRTLASPAEDMSEFSQDSNTRGEDRTQGNFHIHNNMEFNQYSNTTEMT